MQREGPNLLARRELARGLSAALVAFVPDRRPWGYLTAWRAARDLWRVARRKGLLQLPVKLVFDVFSCCAFTCPFLLWHGATSLALHGPEAIIGHGIAKSNAISA